MIWTAAPQRQASTKAAGMASKTTPNLLPTAPGLVAAALLLALTLGTVLAVWLRAEAPARLTGADFAVLRFTFLQATLSGVISCALAIPVARALARRAFPGRGLLITLLGAPFILPVIVAVIGLIAVFGRAGWASQILGLAGFPPLSIYGLPGVVLAHVFFNMPLATRLIFHGHLAIPAEHHRLSAQLGLRGMTRWRILEAPMLLRTLPGAFATIFLLCVASFAVVLALGGGPRATTIELSIYQAFRFDFDLGRAAFLGGVQLGICAIVAGIVLAIRQPPEVHHGLDRPARRWDGATGLAKVTDGALILLATLFLLLPIAAVLTRGIPGLALLDPSAWRALVRSSAVALGATGLSITLSLALTLAIIGLERTAPLRGKLLEGVGYLTIAASPMVMGTGLYILLFPLADPFTLALPLTALVNAALSLPFCLRALLPPARQAVTRFAPLSASIAMGRGAFIRFVLLPRLRRPLGFAAGLTAALSMGDLGVIALFGQPGGETLPLMLYNLLGAYRMEDGAAVGVLLLVASLAYFRAFDWLGGRHAGF